MYKNPKVCNTNSRSDTLFYKFDHRVFLHVLSNFDEIFGILPTNYTPFLKNYTANVLSVEIADKNKDCCVWMITDIFMLSLSKFSSWIYWKLITLCSYCRYLSEILESIFHNFQIFSVFLLNIVIICYFDRVLCAIMTEKKLWMITDKNMYRVRQKY